MRPLVVVVIEELPESGGQLLHGFVVLEIDVIVLHRAPQALDHDVVGGPAFSVHANFDIVVFKHAGIGGAGILRALVGI